VTIVDQPPPAPPAQYEFDGQQNAVIDALADAMQWIATPLLCLGVAFVLVAILQAVEAFRETGPIVPALTNGLAAILAIVLGLWTSLAAGEFRRIVTTRGRDVTHLMTALDSLRKKYTLLSVVVKLYVAFILIALVAAVAMMFYRGPT
jgi:hypothetical protein